MWGGADRFVDPAYGADFAAAIAGALGWSSVDGAGHFPQLERPQETAVLVGDFLA